MLAVVEEGLLTLLLLLLSFPPMPVDVAVVGLPLLRERSNMRSFFSAPPVAMI